MYKILAAISLLLCTSSAFAVDPTVCINRLDSLVGQWDEMSTGRPSILTAQTDLNIVVDSNNDIQLFEVTLSYDSDNSYYVRAEKGCEIKQITKK